MRKITPSLTFLLAIMFSNICFGQGIGYNNIKGYSNLLLYVDQQVEISGTFLETPFTSQNVANKIENSLSSNNIDFKRVAYNQGSPLLAIRIVPSVTVNVNCYAKSYAFDLWILETINDKRVYTYNRVHDCLTVDLKADGTCRTLWDGLNDLMNSFITDWKLAHK